ncbi:DNA repair protein XRCC3 [Holothuria leucospilota]|uniref:DNA repair protein XRCC3 n=1 Tax=Holothuria leucospilota TaxID=206669 RepID=A0A9Q1CJE7_HOLLE|nr:DNA repair protein XRCC3 [Holothuria leucospilota]
MEELDLNPRIVNALLKALDLLNGNCLSKFTKCKLGIGCPILDEFLHGGVLSQGLTEITGESATGKTQLCLQLCLNVQMRVEDGGLDSGAVYVCTEDVFPSRRLQQLIATFHIRHQIDKAKQCALGEKIFVEHVAEKDQLEHCISHRIPILLEKGLVKLIVIDSVAALFRSEFEAHEAFQRAKSLQRFGAQLHQLANKHNIPVICVNQVTANINTQSSSENSFKPALGLAWSNQVQTRLMLKRMPYKLPATSHSSESSDVPNTYEIPVRALEVVFSPHLPRDTAYFVVDANGVKGLK